MLDNTYHCPKQTEYLSMDIPANYLETFHVLCGEPFCRGKASKIEVIAMADGKVHTFFSCADHSAL